MEDEARLSNTTRADNLAGASWMTAGMLGYVVNDALIKWTVEELPLFQAVFLRGLVIVSLLALLIRARGAWVSPKLIRSRALGLRITVEALSTIVYLIALSRAPLAPMTAMLQLVPLAVTFAAARVLGERVQPLRIAALVAGFVGVLLIMRPWSDDFNPWLIGGLVTMVLVVVRELATRNIDQRIPGLLVGLYTGVAIMTMGLAISLVQGWAMPSAIRLVSLATAATFLALGYVATINSVRIGDLSFSAPFRYSIIVFAIALQIIVFGETPDALTLVGAAIIAAGGLVALRTATD